MNEIKSTFSRFQRMPARVAVYVPGTSGPNTEDAALAEQVTEQAAAAFSELFGGATITGAAGAWVSESLGLIREAVNIVYSFTTPETLNRNAGAILEIVERVKREMRQEAVSVEIDNALYLV